MRSPLLFLPLLILLCLLSPTTAFGRRGVGDVNDRAAGGINNKTPKKQQDGTCHEAAALLSRGGATADDRIDAAMERLPEHVQDAAVLYQKLRKWNANISRMPPTELARFQVFRPDDFKKAKEAQDELDRLYQEHPDLSPDQLHNVCQILIWDSLAQDHYGAATMLASGKVSLPPAYQTRMNRFCSIVAEALSSSGGKCLEVGCGCGSLVPSLLNVGISASQIYGVDLSPEMIRHAKLLYPDDNGPTFEAVDFIVDYRKGKTADGDGDLFEVVIFSSSLHDMPDMGAALQKAVSLLRPGGIVVIMHPQGASEVLEQVKSDPVLVKRAMPNAEELRTTLSAMELLIEPAEPNSPEEAREGYLAVLKKK